MTQFYELGPDREIICSSDWLDDLDAERQLRERFDEMPDKQRTLTEQKKTHPQGTLTATQAKASQDTQALILAQGWYHKFNDKFHICAEGWNMLAVKLGLSVRTELQDVRINDDGSVDAMASVWSSDGQLLAQAVGSVDFDRQPTKSKRVSHAQTLARVKAIRAVADWIMTVRHNPTDQQFASTPAEEMQDEPTIKDDFDACRDVKP